jgi:hypothetical protein
MKRFLFFFVFLCLYITTSAQSRYWVGASGGNWSSASNWSTTSGGPGGASSPGASNNVIFDRGFTGNVEMDVLVPDVSFTINSLLVTGAANVALRRTQSGDGMLTLKLASTSAESKGLQINNGSNLTIDAINTGSGHLQYYLALTGAAGVTGEIAGSLFFKGTGVGNGLAALDLRDNVIANYAALVVKNQGMIKYFANTGNTSEGPASNLIMENGSVYEINKDGGVFPEAIWHPGSVLKITGVISTAPAFFGDAYGSLEWDCPGQTVAVALDKNISFDDFNLVNTGYPTPSAVRIKNDVNPDTYTVTVNGNFSVSPNALLEMAGESSDAGDARLRVKGNVVNNGTVIQGDDSWGWFELAGISNQNISGTGIYTGNHLTFVMNGAGATLSSPVKMRCNIELMNGKIKTNAANVLTWCRHPLGGSGPQGGSSLSFIDGPIRLNGTATHYLAPVGKGNIYAPIEYHNLLNFLTTDTVTAEYIRANPQTVYGNNYDPTGNPEVINHISSVEYWTLQKTGIYQAQLRISLHVNESSFCTNLATTFVARFDVATSLWKNCNTLERLITTPGPPYVTGEIMSRPVPALGAFTLASGTNELTNPLPIQLISFDATRLSDTKALLDWQLASYCLPGCSFEIQRAAGDKNFASIGNMPGSATGRTYNFTDNGLKPGLNYYRIKMTDENGVVKYSRTVAVMNGVDGLMLTSLVPTFTDNLATLTIASSKQQKLELLVIDMQGRQVQKYQYSLSRGNTSLSLSLGALPAGVYQLAGIGAEGKTNMIRFVKQ